MPLFPTNMHSFSSQLSFQTAASSTMNSIIKLHHHIFFFLIIVLITVLCIFTFIFYNGNVCWLNPKYNKHLLVIRKKFLLFNYLVHGAIIEIIWTFIPSILLLFMIIPSFALLYSIEEIIEPKLIIKVTGHQWYWTYNYLNYGLILDSYMIPFANLIEGDLRLLEVDNPLLLPIKTPIKFLISSDDVLHSFAVPSLGIKLDAVPGRINSVNSWIFYAGKYYGQCSELCGVNHAFMPIVIIAKNI